MMTYHRRLLVACHNLVAHAASTLGAARAAPLLATPRPRPIAPRLTA